MVPTEGRPQLLNKSGRPAKRDGPFQRRRQAASCGAKIARRLTLLDPLTLLSHRALCSILSPEVSEMSTSLRSAGAHVRLARESDAAQIAKLSGQLGYPSTTEDILRRMRSLEPAALHAVLVAESPAGEVIGWGHRSGNHFIENDVRASP